ncbi:MAG: hypothetical protein ACJ768_02565 [Gaiellaceae bacterium]
MIDFPHRDPEAEHRHELALARALLCNSLRRCGYDVFRGRSRRTWFGLALEVSAQPPRAVALPMGWDCDRVPDRWAYLVAPVWLIGPARQLAVALYHLDRLGAHVLGRRS